MCDLFHLWRCGLDVDFMAFPLTDGPPHGAPMASRGADECPVSGDGDMTRVQLRSSDRVGAPRPRLNARDREAIGFAAAVKYPPTLGWDRRP
jgi:hypothetical protein